jgi:hypothetical protein
LEELDTVDLPHQQLHEARVEVGQAPEAKEVEAIFADEELVPDVQEPPLIDPDLSRRFASLVFTAEASKVAEESILSKRQLAIAQSEAAAFTQALATQAQPESESEEEDEVDGLDALQLVLDESRCVADTYTRRSIPVSKQTNTDCMVSRDVSTTGSSMLTGLTGDHQSNGSSCHRHITVGATRSRICLFIARLCVSRRYGPFRRLGRFGFRSASASASGRDC